ncbi:unnamed protein product, partial [Rotaria magnacalcarata]
MDYTLHEAILLYCQLFHSTLEIQPRECDNNCLLDYIDKWTLNSTPVIIDYRGGFPTKHLYSIQLAFPQAGIYSIDILYEELDLVICNINGDETKWRIIPVRHRIGKQDQQELIECLRQELEGTLSTWNVIKISEVSFHSKIENLFEYDPYSELLELKKINFIDSTEKCEVIPCCVFMVYNTY